MRNDASKKDSLGGEIYSDGINKSHPRWNP